VQAGACPTSWCAPHHLMAWVRRAGSSPTSRWRC
jgi:hypothetical protein